MKITVTITDWCVPFDQVVRGTFEFENEADALAHINATSAAWWAANEGDRCMAEYPDTTPYEPIGELGYYNARYELWGGEQGFHAMLDHAVYAALHEAHYKREFDGKGITRPGYLIVAELSGHKPV